MALHKSKKPEDELDWFTVSYRTIYAAVALVLVAVGLGAGYYWRNQQQPVQPPPQTTPAMTTAQFTAIAGTVKWRRASTFDWVAADKSTALRKGDQVQTLPNSTAEITFFDGTVIHVRSESLIQIEESAQEAGGARRVKTKISSGEVNFTTAKQNVPGSQTEFSTATFRANAGSDTQGSVSTDEKSGQGEVKIFRGVGTVNTKDGQTVSVAQNTALPVSAEGKAGPAIKLPDSPALQAPPHQAEISYPDPAHATTLLAWKPVPGAASYHVVLDTTAIFNKPIVDTRDPRVAQVEVRGLEIGKYYWRVAAIDREAHEGAFSDFARFTVTKPAGPVAGTALPPAKLTIDALDVNGNILNAKGGTEPGATVTINGQRVDVDASGRFNEYIQLDQTGKQIIVVRAVNINGGAAEQRRTVVVGY
jgi:hypothetical protein